MVELSLKARFDALVEDCNKKPDYFDCIELGTGKITKLKENDKPKKVYHGTTFDFETFESDKTQVSSDTGSGFYFSDNLVDVRKYAGDYGLHPDAAGRITDYMETYSRKYGNERTEGLKERGWTEEERLEYVNELIPIPNDKIEIAKKYFNLMDAWDYPKDDKVRRYVLENELRSFEEGYNKYVGKCNDIIEAYLLMENPAIFDQKMIPQGTPFPKTVWEGTKISAEELQKAVKALKYDFQKLDDFRDERRGYRREYYTFKKIAPANKEEMAQSFVNSIQESLSHRNSFWTNDLWNTGGTINEIHHAITSDQLMDRNIIKKSIGEKPAKGEFIKEILIGLGYDGMIIKDANERFNIDEPKNISHFMVFDQEQIVVLNRSKC